MRYEGSYVKDLNLAYIGGGSREWAWCLMRDLALEPAMEGTIRLYDIDHEAAQRNEVIGNNVSAHSDAKAHWQYKAVDSLQEALTGADFVLISILPGTFAEMESDVHAPEKYGVYQTVGDTVGPGGCIRALRTVPMYVVIAEAIREYAPTAWVLNLTNPMSQCVGALYRVFPGIKAFGCCHEVFHAHELLCKMIQENLGEKVHRRDIHCNMAGLNHFTWITYASYKGIDLFPMFESYCLKHADEGVDEGEKDSWKTDTFKCGHRVMMDLFLRYHAIPAAGDRHLSEFLPPWYLKDPNTARLWHFGLTSVAWRKADLLDRLARSERLYTGKETLEITPSGEEGHLMIKALLGLGDMLTNTNLPNIGQVANLPRGVVVETNALFTHNSVLPVMAGELPGGVLGLVMPHAVNQLNILNAAMNCDKKLAFQAFLNEPLMQIELKDAKTLFEEMLYNTASYLPDAFRVPIS